MFAIDLPVNFNSPYKADSIIDFWRRWHITLSRFLRDYLYIPLGGSRCGTFRRYFNLFATMLLGGLWHGAGWMFLLWGFLHGSFLIANHLYRNAVGDRWHMPRILSTSLAFVCVVFAWIPFRATHISTVWVMWRGMLGMDGFAVPALFAGLAAKLHASVINTALAPKDFAYVLAGLMICWFLPNSQQLLRKFRVGLDSPGYRALYASDSGGLAIKPSIAFAVLLGIAFGLAVRGIAGYSEFIYFHF